MFRFLMTIFWNYCKVVNRVFENVFLHLKFLPDKNFILLETQIRSGQNFSVAVVLGSAKKMRFF